MMVAQGLHYSCHGWHYLFGDIQMKTFKALACCIAVMGLLPACSDERAQIIKGTYEESVNVAEQYIDQAVEAWRE